MHRFGLLHHELAGIFRGFGDAFSARIRKSNDANAIIAAVPARPATAPASNAEVEL